MTKPLIKKMASVHYHEGIRAFYIFFCFCFWSFSLTFVFVDTNICADLLSDLSFVPFTSHFFCLLSSLSKASNRFTTSVIERSSRRYLTANGISRKKQQQKNSIINKFLLLGVSNLSQWKIKRISK